MTPKICPQCNKAYDDSKYLYCQRCNAASQVIIVCAKCKLPFHPKYRLCPECGFDRGGNHTPEQNKTEHDFIRSQNTPESDEKARDQKIIGGTFANIENRFQLNERIDEGSTAIIYSATDNLLSRDVVLKVSKTNTEEDEADYRKIFYLEAKYYSKLEHPNILPMYDFFEAESGPILVLRKCKSSLADHIVNSTLSIETKLSILSQIASSIDFLREKNIFHRDIKPENILLDDTNSHAYLIDFGISCGIDDKASNHKLIGTPIYMSPETISVGMNNAFIFDEHEQGFSHSDIFSFGVLTYILLSGHLPFNEIEREKYKNTKWSQSTGFRVMRRETPIPCSERDPSVPSAANDMVLRMLARSPADRPSTAQSAIETIRKSYEGKLIDGAKIFLSYSRQDIGTVRPIAEGLSREGLDVWWDDLIDHGRVWDDQIEAALIEADALLVFVSKESVISKEAKHEWRYWLEYKSKYPVIPVVLDDSRIPYRLAGFQRVYNDEADRTVSDIKQALVSCVERPSLKGKEESAPAIPQRSIKTDFEIKLPDRVTNIPRNETGENITYPKEYLHRSLDSMTIIPPELPNQDT